MQAGFVMDAYQTFIKKVEPVVNISAEEEYQQALDTLEDALEKAGDTLDSPMNPLIDMLSAAIERYESQDSDLTTFLQEAENQPADLALLRTLMRQHKLTGSDLPEIGGKAMVSRVLSGKRDLSRAAIEKLSKRFGLRPGMFFGCVG